MKIVGINKDISSFENGMGDRFLILDNVADAEFIHIFNDLHKRNMALNKRAVSLSGRQLIVKCPMDEIQSQVELINTIFMQTDRYISDAQEKQRIAHEEKIRIVQEKRAAAQSEFDKLKF